MSERTPDPQLESAKQFHDSMDAATAAEITNQHVLLDPDTGERRDTHVGQSFEERHVEVRKQGETTNTLYASVESAEVEDGERVVAEDQIAKEVQVIKHGRNDKSHYETRLTGQRGERAAAILRKRAGRFYLDAALDKIDTRHKFVHGVADRYRTTEN